MNESLINITFKNSNVANYRLIHPNAPCASLPPHPAAPTCEAFDKANTPPQHPPSLTSPAIRDLELLHRLRQHARLDDAQDPALETHPAFLDAPREVCLREQQDHPSFDFPSARRSAHHLSIASGGQTTRHGPTRTPDGKCPARTQFRIVAGLAPTSAATSRIDSAVSIISNTSPCPATPGPAAPSRAKPRPAVPSLAYSDYTAHPGMSSLFSQSCEINIRNALTWQIADAIR